ncbi:hypothetical protein ABZ896_51140 [Streptomyces sp. NPDC047072]|uniref:hypothetical protein n=1 Tax=Streptomyces sp. NPDC047072 TaxID=3154809 RepID=UPI0034063C4B
MTAQIPDEIRLRGQRFAVTAVDGSGLFDPAAYGMQPRATSTGCYRGRVCRYVVDQGLLVLHELEVGLEGEPPPLAGVRPRQDESGSPAWTYRGLGLPAAFTGRLLVGDGKPDEILYLNMGFRPAWMYREVRELTFWDGTLLSVTDHSAELAEVRAEIGTTATRPSPGEPVREWISRTFSLSYAYSWPGRRS